MLQTGFVACDPAGHGGEAAYRGKLGCRSVSYNKNTEEPIFLIIIYCIYLNYTWVVDATKHYTITRQIRE